MICQKKIKEEENKLDKKVESLNEKIKIESKKEEEALNLADVSKPGLNTQELAMNPKFEKQIRKKRVEDLVNIIQAEPTYANVLMGQTQRAGKKN